MLCCCKKQPGPKEMPQGDARLEAALKYAREWSNTNHCAHNVGIHAFLASLAKIGSDQEGVPEAVLAAVLAMRALPPSEKWAIPANVSFVQCFVACFAVALPMKSNIKLQVLSAPYGGDFRELARQMGLVTNEWAYLPNDPELLALIDEVLPH